MQSEYPMVNFVPGDSEAIRSGTVIRDLVDNIAERFKSTKIELPPVDPEKMRISMEADRLMDSIGLGPNAGLAAYVAAKQARVEKLAQESALKEPRVTDTSPRIPDQAVGLAQSIVTGTLHDAFNAFIAWIEKEYYRSDLGRISDWGLQQRRDVRSLIAHHRDMPLAVLDYDGVDDMIGYWRRRPLRRNSSKAVAIKSASNFISVPRSFLRFRWSVLYWFFTSIKTGHGHY